MTQEQQQESRTPEEIALARETLRTRSAAMMWAAQGTNIENYVKPEYRRRVERGEGLMIAWRRAIWASFKQNGESL